MDKIHKEDFDFLFKSVCGIQTNRQHMGIWWNDITCLKCLKKGQKRFPRNRVISERYKLLKYKNSFQELIDNG